MGSVLLSRRDFLRTSARGGVGLAIAPLVPMLSRTAGNRAVLRRAQYVMGTIVSIEVHGESRAHCYDALTRAFEELHRLDRLMSLYKAESQLCIVNNSAGQRAVSVDPSLIEVIKHARVFHSLTQGAFDITIEPLMRVWGFRNNSIDHTPSDLELAQAHEALGFHHVELDEQNAMVGLNHPHAALDFGGIAVGYAVDRVAAILRSEGIEAALMNHSGDVYALGSPEDADGWLVALPNPAEPRELATTVVLKECALSTSAIYEKYLDLDGVRYGHILDPSTGRPSRTMKSISVIAPTAIAADALSTGTFLMREEEARSIVARLPGVRLLVIDQNGVRES
jgi:thiamine biosynthesis lipoprotein